MNSKLLLLMIGSAFLALTHAATWDYGTNGPSTWGDNYADCNGTSQSPIDIDTSAATIDYSLPIVNRSHFYTPPTKMTVQNNGHAIVMGFTEGNYIIDDDKLLPFPAKIVQYHLHWGSSAMSGGAEHTIDKKHYFGELHAVHMNTKYDNIGEAIDKADGLAVFGWFIDVTYPQTNKDMEFFLNIAKNGAEMKDSSTSVSTVFSLETLLPPNLDVYYRYSGSLTTPGCFESVVWTVFEKPIEITREQADFLATSFYSTNSTADVLNANYRPVQKLNGRKVTKPAPLVQDSGATAAQSSVIAVVASAILVMLF